MERERIEVRLRRRRRGWARKIQELLLPPHTHTLSSSKNLINTSWEGQPELPLKKPLQPLVGELAAAERPQSNGLKETVIKFSSADCPEKRQSGLSGSQGRWLAERPRMYEIVCVCRCWMETQRAFKDTAAQETAEEMSWRGS